MASLLAIWTVALEREQNALFLVPLSHVRARSDEKMHLCKGIHFNQKWLLHKTCTSYGPELCLKQLKCPCQSKLFFLQHSAELYVERFL